MIKDVKRFFDNAKYLFGGRYNQDTVDFLDAFIKEWNARGLTDLRYAAYMLATVIHETAGTMLPLEEYGKGRNRPYGKPDVITGKVYFGRGYVQLTWKYNYEKAGKILGVDLVNNPEKAMDHEVALRILFDGMLNGWFTGKSLKDYFTTKATDWYNARKIINGLDKASKIESKAKKFYKALTE